MKTITRTGHDDDCTSVIDDSEAAPPGSGRSGDGNGECSVADGAAWRRGRRRTAGSATGGGAGAGRTPGAEKPTANEADADAAARNIGSERRERERSKPEERGERREVKEPAGRLRSRG